jgi:hypothetical protein
MSKDLDLLPGADLPQESAYARVIAMVKVHL